MNVVSNGDESHVTTTTTPLLPVGVRPAQQRQVSSPQRRHVGLFLLVGVTRPAESSAPTLVGWLDWLVVSTLIIIIIIGLSARLGGILRALMMRGGLTEEYSTWSVVHVHALVHHHVSIYAVRDVGGEQRLCNSRRVQRGM